MALGDLAAGRDRHGRGPPRWPGDRPGRLGERVLHPSRRQGHRRADGGRPAPPAGQGRLRTLVTPDPHRGSNGSVPASTAAAAPSTGITAPFTYDAASDSSHPTTAATSSARAARRAGTSDVTSESASPTGSPPRSAPKAAISSSAISVIVQPRHTTLAPSPWCAWSTASDWVSTVSHHLDLQPGQVHAQAQVRAAAADTEL